jgi:hypothetical protein
MTSGNSVVAAKAFEVLATLGYDRAKVAAEVGCHPRTVRRWELGKHQPSKRNRTALRALIGQLLMVELAGPDTARTEARRKRLNIAAEALMTRDEKADARAERDELDTKARAFHAEARERRSAEMAERYAEVRAQVAADRQARRDRVAAAVTAVEKWRPKRSAFADCDPFTIFGQPEPALPF